MIRFAQFIFELVFFLLVGMLKLNAILQQFSICARTLGKKTFFLLLVLIFS